MAKRPRKTTLQEMTRIKTRVKKQQRTKKTKCKYKTDKV